PSCQPRTVNQPGYRDLVLPACPEVVLVPDRDPWPAGVTYPDAILVGRVFQGEGRVAVGSSSHLECVQDRVVAGLSDLGRIRGAAGLCCPSWPDKSLDQWSRPLALSPEPGSGAAPRAVTHREACW